MLNGLPILDVWDDSFQQALVAALAGRLVISLTGDKGLAQLKMGEANQYITLGYVRAMETRA